MKWIEVVLEVPREMEELVVDKLYEYEIDGVNIEDEKLIFDMHDSGTGWEIIDLPEEKPGDSIRLKVFFNSDDYNDFIKVELLEYIEKTNGAIQIIKEEILDNMDWANEWKKYFKVLKLGESIVIKPSWEEYSEVDGEIVIDIDPGMAFGTGTHASTAMCLKILEKQNVDGQDILDIGSGSGILSIAAAKLGAKSVTAIDIDPVCVKTTKENADLNNCSDVINAIEADLTEGLDGQYDYALINIIAEVIVHLLDYLHVNLKSGSKLILSGIIEENTDKVTDKLNEMGYRVLELNRESGWTSILAEYINA